MKLNRNYIEATLTEQIPDASKKDQEAFYKLSEKVAQTLESELEDVLEPGFIYEVAGKLAEAIANDDITLKQ